MTARRLGAGVLAALACLSMLGATLSYWANRNLLDTEVWVERTGPTVDDPEVQLALTNALTDQVMSLVDTRGLIESALTPKGQILAMPLHSAIDTFVEEQVAAFVAGDRFRRMWSDLMQRGHRVTVATLRGQSTGRLDTAGGTVSMDLVPAIDAILVRLTTISPELFGRSVTIPTISVDDLPTVARERLGRALGVDLDDGFGTVTIYDSSELRSVQNAVRIFDRLLPLTATATVTFGIAALTVSRRRRRTALQLVVGFSLMLVLVRRLALRTEADVFGLISDPSALAAVRVVIAAFVDPLIATTGWILWGLAVIVALLVLTGPYGWAVTLRHMVADAARNARSATGSLPRGAASTGDDRARHDTGTAWVRRHASTLQWTGVAVAIGILWFVDLSWWGVFAVGVVIGVTEFVVSRIASRRGADPLAG